MYEASESGDVRNFKTKRIIKPSVSEGRLKHKLKNTKGERVTTSAHRLVADAFLPGDINNFEVDHIDRDRKNNHYSNLRLVDRKTNLRNSRYADDRISFINSVISLHLEGLSPTQIYEETKKHPR